MAISIADALSGANWVIDQVMGAARVSLRPGPVDGWSSYGPKTAALSGLVAGAVLMSLRNTGSKQLVIRRFQMSWVQTTAFTTAQRLEWELHVARSWTAADTGGVQLNVNSGRHRQGLSALSMDARYNIGVAVTAGTRTLDAHPIAAGSLWAGGVGATTGVLPMITTDAGDHPVVVGPSEGIVLTNAFAMGAGGAGIAYLGLEIAEGIYP